MASDEWVDDSIAPQNLPNTVLNSPDYQVTKLHNVNRFLNCYSIDELANAIAPKRKTKVAYMCLDTLYARFLENNTKVQWDFIETLTEGPNSTNVVSKVRDITSIRMLSIVTPQFPSIAQRASITIDEFKAQAFILPNGHRFHFIGLLNNLATGGAPLSLRNAASINNGSVLDYTIVNKYELLAGYKFNEGYYRFNKPIVSVDTITVSIADPFIPIQLPKYQYINIPIVFENQNTVRLTFPELVQLPGAKTQPQNLGNRWITTLFISNFTTSQPDIDKTIIDYINLYEYNLMYNLTNGITNTITISITDYVLIGCSNPITGGITTEARPSPPLPIGITSLVTVQFNTNRIVMNFEIEYYN
jgi:hypothetical protein